MANNIENFVIQVSTKGVDGLKSLGNTIVDVSNKVSGLNTALAGVGFGAFIKGALDAADRISDLADATGMTIGNILAFENALAAAGGRAQSAERVITAFYQSIENANEGSLKARDAFAAVGVTLNDLKNASEQEILSKTLEGLSKMEAGANRTALATTLLSKAFRSVDPAAFKAALDSGDFTALEASIKAGADSAQQMEMAYRNLQLAALETFQPMLKLLGDTTFGLDNAKIAVKVLAASVALLFGAKAIAAAAAFIALMREWNVLTKGQVILQSALQALQGPKGWAVLAGAAAAAGVAIYGLNELLDENAKKTQAAGGTTGGGVPTPKRPANRTQGEDSRQRQAREAREREAERLKKLEQDATLEITKQVAEYTRSIDIMKARNELEHQLVGFTTTAAEEKRRMFDLEQERTNQISKINAQIYATEKDKINAIAEVNKKYQEGLSTLELDTAKRLAGVYAVKDANIEMFARLADLRAQDLLSEEEYQAARMALILETNAAIFESERKRIEDTKLLELQRQEGSQFGYETQKQMAREAADFAMKSDMEKTQFALKNASDMMTSLGSQNKKAFEAAKAFNIANAIMNTYMGATKALATYPPPFNFIAAAAVVASGMAQVANIKSQSYSGRALGGPVNATSPYMVGENGPEVFVPKTSGQIVRNEDLSKLGRGSNETQPPAVTNVSYTIQAVDASSFRSLIAADPEFIHSVAERGRSRSPTRMR